MIFLHTYFFLLQSKSIHSLVNSYNTNKGWLLLWLYSQSAWIRNSAYLHKRISDTTHFIQIPLESCIFSTLKCNAINYFVFSPVKKEKQQIETIFMCLFFTGKCTLLVPHDYLNACHLDNGLKCIQITRFPWILMLWNLGGEIASNNVWRSSLLFFWTGCSS